MKLLINAKLEAVDCGITTVEDEFLASTLLPDGQTMGQWSRPQLAAAHHAEKMPPLLLGVSTDDEHAEVAPVCLLGA